MIFSLSFSPPPPLSLPVQQGVVSSRQRGMDYICFANRFLFVCFQTSDQRVFAGAVMRYFIVRPQTRPCVHYVNGRLQRPPPAQESSLCLFVYIFALVSFSFRVSICSPVCLFTSLSLSLSLNHVCVYAPISRTFSPTCTFDYRYSFSLSLSHTLSLSLSFIPTLSLSRVIYTNPRHTKRYSNLLCSTTFICKTTWASTRASTHFKKNRSSSSFSSSSFCLEKKTG